LIFALLVSAVSVQADECRRGSVQLRGDWGQARFAVAVADTDRSRARGLMYRRSMAPTEGMLFVYKQPGPVAFWMKNTLIPLDMIFVDQNGVVQMVHPMARPHDETPIFGGQSIKFVLEINGGIAASLGIDAGSQMRHPAIVAQGAAWPC